jgi:hypothetical protein
MPLSASAAGAGLSAGVQLRFFFHRSEIDQRSRLSARAVPGSIKSQIELPFFSIPLQQILQSTLHRVLRSTRHRRARILGTKHQKAGGRTTPARMIRADRGCFDAFVLEGASLPDPDGNDCCGVPRGSAGARMGA